MSRNFVDLHINSRYSKGDDDFSRIVSFAEKLDISSIVVFETVETSSDITKLKEIKNRISQIRTRVKIYIGAELKNEDSDKMKSLITKARSKVDILAVCGGNLDINRIAVENPVVDILLNPEFSRRDSGLDEVMVKLAAKNHVAIEFNFRTILHTYSKVRSHILSHMRHNWTLVKRMDAPFIITSSANNVWDMRTGRELASFGTLVGMELSTALDAVSTNCETIIENAVKKK